MKHVAVIAIVLTTLSTFAGNKEGEKTKVITTTDKAEFVNNNRVSISSDDHKSIISVELYNPDALEFSVNIYQSNGQQIKSLIGFDGVMMEINTSLFMPGEYNVEVIGSEKYTKTITIN